MQPCPWIPRHWLSCLCNTMHHNDLTIKYKTWKLLPLWEHGQFLMDEFHDYSIPRNHLEKLNAYWMYLQVMTLSKISDQMGTMLLPQVLMSTGNPIPKGLTTISMSLLKWPTIHLPMTSCWRLWTRTISTLYTGSLTGMRLCQLLGQWRQEYSQHQFPNSTNAMAIWWTPSNPHWPDYRTGMPTGYYNGGLTHRYITESCIYNDTKSILQHFKRLAMDPYINHAPLINFKKDSSKKNWSSW